MQRMLYACWHLRHALRLTGGLFFCWQIDHVFETRSCMNPTGEDTFEFTLNQGCVLPHTHRCAPTLSAVCTPKHTLPCVCTQTHTPALISSGADSWASQTARSGRWDTKLPT